MKMRTADVTLPGGRVLRLALTFNEAGEPEDLCIGAGFTDDAPLRVLGRGLNVPSSALPALRDALATLVSS